MTLSEVWEITMGMVQIEGIRIPDDSPSTKTLRKCGRERDGATAKNCRQKLARKESSRDSEKWGNIRWKSKAAEGPLRHDTASKCNIKSFHFSQGRATLRVCRSHLQKRQRGRKLLTAGNSVPSPLQSEIGWLRWPEGSPIDKLSRKSDNALIWLW